jgi:hypothetical protein
MLGLKVAGPRQKKQLEPATEEATRTRDRRSNSNPRQKKKLEPATEEAARTRDRRSNSNPDVNIITTTLLANKLVM